MNFQLLLKMSGDACTSKTLNCAPVIHYEKSEFASLESFFTCLENFYFLWPVAKSKITINWEPTAAWLSWLDFFGIDKHYSPPTSSEYSRSICSRSTFSTSLPRSIVISTSLSITASCITQVADWNCLRLGSQNIIILQRTWRTFGFRWRSTHSGSSPTPPRSSTSWRFWRAAPRGRSRNLPEQVNWFGQVGHVILTWTFVISSHLGLCPWLF